MANGKGVLGASPQSLQLRGGHRARGHGRCHDTTDLRFVVTVRDLAHVERPCCAPCAAPSPFCGLPSCRSWPDCFQRGGAGVGYRQISRLRMPAGVCSATLVAFARALSSARATGEIQLICWRALSASSTPSVGSPVRSTPCRRHRSRWRQKTWSLPACAGRINHLGNLQSLGQKRMRWSIAQPLFAVEVVAVSERSPLLAAQCARCPPP